MAYERRVREQKLRVEMMQARRENAAFKEMVETGKKLDKIEERKRKRGHDKNDSTVPTTGTSSRSGSAKEKRAKHFQTKPLSDGTDKPTKRALLSGLV